MSKENGLQKYYTQNICSGMSKIFTPKEVRDKMTIHAKVDMKILVMFNFEFCYDLNKMGCKDVMFVSDDELRNEIVEKTWGFKTKLIDPKDINKSLNGMKFDLIISNPPYNKNLDLKILQEVMPIGDRICFVHPAGWILDNTFYYKKHIDVSKIYNLNNIELIDSNKIFNIGLFMPYAITFFNIKNDCIHIHDSSKHFFNDTHSWDVTSILEIDKYGWYKNYKDIKNKIFNSKGKHINSFSKFNSNIHRENIYEAIPSNKLKITLGVASIRGNVASNDFYTIVQNDEEKHTNHTYEFGWNFNQQIEAHNCYCYLKTKFARFCLSVLKLHRNNAYFLSKLPWFDFTKSWTDEECARELGITDEELLWMIQQIPNYYPEDEAKYKELENKLTNI